MYIIQACPPDFKSNIPHLKGSFQIVVSGYQCERCEKDVVGRAIQCDTIGLNLNGCIKITTSSKLA